MPIYWVPCFVSELQIIDFRISGFKIQGFIPFTFSSFQYKQCLTKVPEILLILLLLRFQIVLINQNVVFYIYYIKMVSISQQVSYSKKTLI